MSTGNWKNSVLFFGGGEYYFVRLLFGIKGSIRRLYSLLEIIKVFHFFHLLLREIYENMFSIRFEFFFVSFAKETKLRSKDVRNLEGGNYLQALISFKVGKDV